MIVVAVQAANGLRSEWVAKLEAAMLEQGSQRKLNFVLLLDFVDRLYNLKDDKILQKLKDR